MENQVIQRKCMPKSPRASGYTYTYDQKAKHDPPSGSCVPKTQKPAGFSQPHSIREWGGGLVLGAEFRRSDSGRTASALGQILRWAAVPEARRNLAGLAGSKRRASARRWLLCFFWAHGPRGFPFFFVSPPPPRFFPFLGFRFFGRTPTTHIFWCDAKKRGVAGVVLTGEAINEFGWAPKNVGPRKMFNTLARV